MIPTMQRLLSYARQLTIWMYYSDHVYSDVDEHGQEIELRVKMTDNDLDLMRQERKRIMDRIYRWQRKSGNIITRQASKKRRVDPVPADCFSVKDFANEIRA